MATVLFNFGPFIEMKICTKHFKNSKVDSNFANQWIYPEMFAKDLQNFHSQKINLKMFAKVATISQIRHKCNSFEYFFAETCILYLKS